MRKGAFMESSTETTLLWFRQDLRLSDNFALQAALKSGRPVFCFFIWDETTPATYQLGGASKWWLHQSLASLDQALRARGNKLHLFRGDPRKILPDLLHKVSGKAVFWNRCYDAHSIARDKGIKTALKESLIEVESFNSHLLYEPWALLNQSGKPYKVFTPFWKKGCLSLGRAWPKPYEPPKRIPEAKHSPVSEKLSSWKLLPRKPNWAKTFSDYWEPGEQGARKQLHLFLSQGVHDYQEGRNFPAKKNVSLLSPHLHWGEIAPWRIWDEAETAAHQDKTIKLSNLEIFQNELGWREFSYSLLYHFPELPRKNFRSEFDAFPWNTNKKGLLAWQQGKTGYPLVDAGMRQLWQTGWMHNRVRMVVASFLVKDLRLHWHQGEKWFWDTLVDADLASNSASWQWVAGCGADAAPYFRIFNPITQSEKFDPEGEYIRQWVPELALLEKKYIHCPWKAPTEILQKAHIVLGKTYPKPIVDHDIARKEALIAYKKIRK